MIDSKITARLFSLAKACIASGNRPMPAVLLRDGAIAFESTDRVMADTDPTMHGEIAVIRLACRALDTLSLKGYGMACFGEPCLMCCGAIHWAKLDWVAYCLSQERLKTLSGGRSKPGIRDYLPLGNRGTDLYGPIEEEEAFSIAADYDWVGKAVH